MLGAKNNSGLFTPRPNPIALCGDCKSRQTSKQSDMQAVQGMQGIAGTKESAHASRHEHNKRGKLYAR